jgi:peptidoglycan/LPS O-acetylase OafA/YrhL
MMTNSDNYVNLHQYRNIELLRGCAAILVVLSHIHANFGVKLGWLAVNGGWLGVQIFFIISGYLIIKSAEKYNSIEYFIHRFFRIWPAYIFWFAVVGVATGKINWGSLMDLLLYPHIILMQHFYPSSYMKYDVLRTSWTLTVEVIWYLAAYVLVRIGRGIYIPAAVVSVIVATWWVYSGKQLHPSWGARESIYDYYFITNIFLAQLPFFFFGCVIAMEKFKPSLFYCSFLAIAIFSTYDDWINSVPNPIFVTGIAIGAVFYILTVVEFSFQNEIISFFSDISYSIYLIHFPVILLVLKIMHGGYLAAIVAIVLTVFFAWVSHRLIERPFINVGRVLSKKYGKKSMESMVY